ncbi:MAG: LysM peptidoglycan-binding domain-containing protein [Anaerolineales bacterium]|nr:LysM peptidoglycan-binding domain-containing protein [Anaerolineales bacterium]
MTFLKQVVSGVLVAFAFLSIVFVSLITTFAEGLLVVSLPSVDSQDTLSCPRPLNWFAVELQEGDTLADLARSMGAGEDDILEANCLTDAPEPGDTIFVPPLDLRDGERACGPPQGWRFYSVQAMEDLKILARRFDIAEEALRQANCLTPSHSISEGERLFIPILTTPTATATDHGVETPSAGPPSADETPEPTASS